MISSGDVNKRRTSVIDRPNFRVAPMCANCTRTGWSAGGYIVCHDNPLQQCNVPVNHICNNHILGIPGQF